MLAVAVALSPASYDFGAESPDGSSWEVLGEEYKTNPKLLLDEGDFEMVTLWSLYRAGHLPAAGGTLDQPSMMLDAFAVMESAERKLRKS